MGFGEKAAFRAVLASAAALALWGTLFGGGNAPATAWATAVEPPMVPASFSQLAELVGPAVVNIRTVKTLKGGGPVLRHFQKEPFGREQPFNDSSSAFSATRCSGSSSSPV